MNRYSRFGLWAALCLFAACSTKEEATPTPPSDQEIILTATTEGNDGTRTTLNADYSTVLWMPKESLSVFSGGKMVAFTSTNTEKASSAQFKGTLPEASGDKVIYGLYPYSAEASISKDVISTSLPAEQVAVAGTFGDNLFISVARTETYEMGFYNVCSGLRFMLDRSDIQTVTFLSNGGEPLVGKFSVGFDKDGKPIVQAVEEGSPEVTLSAPEGKTFEAGVWYYLVTLPTNLTKGYTILLEGEDIQGTVRSSTSIALNRNKFRSSKLDASRVDYKTVDDYDIENSGVRAYLENVDYSDDPDYTRSEVSNYPGTDKPNPVKLSWEGKASTVRISTSPDLSGSWDVSVSESPASIYNLTPGVRHFYSVLAADGTVLRESCVIPKGPMRMINGLLKNSRDLGGWKAGDKTIRYGKIYRGANLDDIQQDASKMDIIVNRLGVGVDLDLRGLPPGSQGGSGENNPWKPTDPVIYKNIKLWHYFVPSAQKYLQVDVSPGETADQYQYAIRCIINWLKDGKVVYFHCHGGADRTGTLAFLLEGLLGVSESDMSKDFEVTTYSNSIHRRNCDGGWFYRGMVMYIRTFAPGKTIQEQVTAWAKTRHSEDVDPLTDQEIQELKDLMLE
ncbi:MAG: tyrosine-protein phosphatase [Bacteroidales bacterium]|nr:tyrosine-protein phosphatase [Fibrobacter sp.]MBR3387240.1 tyrosine-protein phosphatase [Bacteroidales bacterium]